MNGFKLLFSDDIQPEITQRVVDLILGNEDLSAFFEDPYLDSILTQAVNDESCATAH